MHARAPAPAPAPRSAQSAPAPAAPAVAPHVAEPAPGPPERGHRLEEIPVSSPTPPPVSSRLGPVRMEQSLPASALPEDVLHEAFQATAASPVEFGETHDPSRNLTQLSQQVAAGDESRAFRSGQQFVIRGASKGPVSRPGQGLKGLGRELSARLPFRKFRFQREGGTLQLAGKLNPWVIINGVLVEVDDASNNSSTGPTTSPTTTSPAPPPVHNALPSIHSFLSSPSTSSSSGPPSSGYSTHGTPSPSSYGYGAPSPSSYGYGAPSPSPYGYGAPSPSPYGYGTPSPSPYGYGTPSPSPYGYGTPSPYGYGYGMPPYGYGMPSPSSYGYGAPSPSSYGYGAPSMTSPAMGPSSITSSPSPSAPLSSAPPPSPSPLSTSTTTTTTTSSSKPSKKRKPPANNTNATPSTASAPGSSSTTSTKSTKKLKSADVQERERIHSEYKNKAKQSADALKNTVPSSAEKTGTQAQLASTFYQNAREAHIRRKLAKSGTDPKTHTAPYAQDNPIDSMTHLNMGHGVETIRTSKPGKSKTVNRRFGSTSTNVNLPREGASSGSDLLKMTTVSLQGVGRSTKYSVMAQQKPPVHPMHAANPTHNYLNAEEATRSGGRDHSSVVAKMRLAKTGNLTPQEAIDPEAHGTFELPGAQSATDNQARLIARNTGNTLHLWANGPGAPTSTPPSAPSTATSSSTTSTASPPSPAPSLAPPGSPRGQRFLNHLNNLETGSPGSPAPEDLHGTNEVLTSLDSELFAPRSPLGYDSENEAYEEQFGKKPKWTSKK